MRNMKFRSPTQNSVEGTLQKYPAELFILKLIYVRVREFSRWIANILGQDADEVCWNKNFQNRMKLLTG